MAYPSQIFGLEVHEWALIVAGVCIGFACLFSIWGIFMHLRRYVNPPLQRAAVRLTLMIPIYAIDSYLSMVFRPMALYLAVARDCYEAYVIYVFFRMLIEYADGEEGLIEKLEDVPQIRYSLPLCCWHIKPGRIFVHRCKQFILQYVFVKPILAIAVFILDILHIYQEGDFSPRFGYLYITIVYNISITLALYFLVLFYEGTKTILAPYKPILKFLTVKGIIFFSFWQGVLIAILAHFEFIIKGNDDWSTPEVSTFAQNTIMCIEMVPYVFAFHYTFGYRNFYDPHKNILTPASKAVWRNWLHVMNIKDVVSDTVTSLKKGPQRKVQVGDFLNISREEQIQRIAFQGWLEKRGEDLGKIWKKRYCLLLKEPFGLVYFKQNPFANEEVSDPSEPVARLKARGYVDFKGVKGLASREKLRFEVVTTGRKWHFRAIDERQRVDWLFHIDKLLTANSITPVIQVEESPEEK